MKIRWTLLLLALANVPLAAALALAADAPTRVLIVSGPSSHPAGTHETAAGARLLAHSLNHAENLPQLAAEVVTAWPTDRAELESVATIVFLGDRFPPEEMPERVQIMADLHRLVQRGCGMVCVHYATGLGAQHVAPDGSHPLLGWIGGYFATRCPHHQSIARVWTATIEPAKREHPVLRGWSAFTLHDEPYINNYFGPQGMADNVVPLATAMLPPENPQHEVVAWAVDRADGGRGMGVVMPHFYRNWQNDDLRMLIVNGVVWTAGRDVPADGVRTATPDLKHFAPEALEPQPRTSR
jgi:type 1 glutamine amidotransferase